MEVNLLGAEELKYELAIRGLPITGTFAQKRNALREILRYERENNISAPTSSCYDSESELIVCQGKLYTLARDIDCFDFRNRDNEYRRISTFLSHVHSRLLRISCAIDAECRHKELLIDKCKELFEKLRLMKEGRLNGTVTQRENIKDGCSVEVNRSILDSDNPPLLHSNLTPITKRQVDTSISYDLIVLDDKVPDQIFENDLDERYAFSNTAGNDEINGNSDSGVQDYERAQHSMPFSSQLLGNNRSNQFSDHVESPKDNRRSVPPSKVHFEDELFNISKQVHANSTRRDETLSHSNPYVNFADRLENFRFSPSNGQAMFSQPYLNPIKFQDVSSWNVKYNGQSSVTDFLERIEELRLSRGVSKEMLLRSAPEIFTRDALLWFRTRRFSSWDDLVTQLRETFQPFDYEFSLWDEIHKRTQGSQERVISFVVSMEALFRKLPSPPSEVMKLQVIRRNLLPHIQRRLATERIENLQDLIRLSRSIEETEARIQKFAPPSTNYRNLLEPALAYHKPSSHLAVLESPLSLSSGSSEIVSEVAALKTTYSSSCWNCCEPGHHFRQCQKPLKRFCFKCGNENVISRNCPKCSKNGY